MLHPDWDVDEDAHRYPTPVGWGDLPLDSDGDGDGQGAWTGQKRRKHRGPSSSDAARGGTIGQEDHEEPRGETIGQEDHEEPPNEIARAMDMDMIAPSDSLDELAELENDTISTEEFNSCVQVLFARPSPSTFGGGRMDDEQQREVYERLALYRIRASKLAQGVSRDELDDTTLRKEYSSDALEGLHYFDHYDKSDSVDWYFDPDYSMLSCLGDYHRLVLKNGEDGAMYVDWEKYHSWFTSYEMDEEYVKYCEEISKKIKWIKRYMECEQGSCEFVEMQNRAFRQAAKIAINFPHINYDLAFTAYLEYIWNMESDYWQREEIGHLLFEIWKRITKQNVSIVPRYHMLRNRHIAFGDAVDEVNRGDMFRRHKKYMQFCLDRNDFSSLKRTFDTCVEGIPDNVAEDDAHDLIVSAVWSKLPKGKTWEKYIMRKMEIAKYIGLDPKA